MENQSFANLAASGEALLLQYRSLQVNLAMYGILSYPPILACPPWYAQAKSPVFTILKLELVTDLCIGLVWTGKFLCWHFSTQPALTLSNHDLPMPHSSNF